MSIVKVDNEVQLETVEESATAIVAAPLVEIRERGQHLLPPCDPEILSKGTPVFMTHTIDAKSMEAWVQAVASESGQRVDWSFVAGRAIVRAIGDLNKVRAAMLKLKPWHDLAYRRARAKITGVFAFVDTEMIIPWHFLEQGDDE